MKITFLGTGTSQGIPVVTSDHPVCLSTDAKDKRLRSSIMIQWNQYCYIIDCGPDFRYQMLRENVQRIDGILFTHEHADHTAGLDDIRPFGWQLKKVPLYASNRVFDSLNQRFSYILDDENKYPSAPSVVQNRVEDIPFLLGGIKVTPIQIFHGKLPILGYRFSNFAYLTDLKTITTSEKEKLLNLDVLVVNALRIKEHPTHFNLDEALLFIKEIQPKKAYLTHISHKLGFHKEVEKQLPKNVFLAYDGLTIKVNA